MVQKAKHRAFKNDDNATIHHRIKLRLVSKPGFAEFGKEDPFFASFTWEEARQFKRKGGKEQRSVLSLSTESQSKNKGQVEVAKISLLSELKFSVLAALNLCGFALKFVHTSDRGSPVSRSKL